MVTLLDVVALFASAQGYVEMGGLHMLPSNHLYKSLKLIVPKKQLLKVIAYFPT